MIRAFQGFFHLEHRFIDFLSAILYAPESFLHTSNYVEHFSSYNEPLGMRSLEHRKREEKEENRELAFHMSIIGS